jgi:hypothetical protein
MNHSTGDEMKSSSVRPSPFESISFLHSKNRKMASGNRPASAKRNEAATTGSAGAQRKTFDKKAVVISSQFPFCIAKTGNWYREIDPQARSATKPQPRPAAQPVRADAPGIFIQGNRQTRASALNLCAIWNAPQKPKKK